MGNPPSAGDASEPAPLATETFIVRDASSPVCVKATLASRSSSSASAVSEGTPAVTSPKAPPCWFSFKPWSIIIVCSPAVAKSSVGSDPASAGLGFASASSSSAARSESLGTSVVMPPPGAPPSSEVSPEVNVKFSVPGLSVSESSSSASPAGDSVAPALCANSCPGSMVTLLGRCFVRSSDCGVTAALGVGAPVDSAAGVPRVKSD
mmetsp:Transcript_7773/g.31499  ORF Transcript_7773/g.31499 Transcript_7773/m.31499 type:complete len:207 (-) Transcript_7773:1075-1695(-)